MEYVVKHTNDVIVMRKNIALYIRRNYSYCNVIVYEALAVLGIERTGLDHEVRFE